MNKNFKVENFKILSIKFRINRVNFDDDILKKLLPGTSGTDLSIILTLDFTLPPMYEVSHLLK